MTDRTTYHLTELIGPRDGNYRDKSMDPAALADLARRVERLTPHPGRPERFHEDKSEIVAELRRLAKEVRHG